MTASTTLKALFAGAATVALIGTALAQGNPPNPAVKNAPTGAGQQSSQQTPMGTTGTPAGGAMAPGSTSGTRSNMGSSNMGTSNMGTSNTGNMATSNMGTSSTTGSGSSMGSSSTSADTTMASAPRAKRHVRKARADRN
jgi:hypothetical protein